MRHSICQKVTDKCFINSLRITKQNSRTTIFHSLFFQIALVFLIIVSHNRTPAFYFFCIAFILALLHNALELFHNIFYLSSSSIIMRTADKLDHVINIDSHSEQLSYYCQIPYTTETYDVQQVFDEVEQINRGRIQTRLSEKIDEETHNIYPCLKYSNIASKICSLVLTGIGIFAIVIFNQEQAKKGVEIIFESLVSIVKYELVFFGMLACICLPIALALFLMLFCYKKYRKVVPSSAPATVQVIKEADTLECAICFNQLRLGEPVVVLPCSQKHIFHEKCINQWAKVNESCPICRKSLD